MRREFDQVWHGFDRNQVRQYVDHVEMRVGRILSDRDAAMAQASTLSRELENARREMTKLRERVEELKKPPERLDDLDERMHRTVDLANARAEEITARAQVAAEEHWAKTTEASTGLRERYRTLLQQLDSHAEQMQQEHESALESTRIEVRELTSEAARRRKAMDAQSENRRRTVEREFEARVSADRATLEKHIADQQTASKNQAERRIAEATALARRKVEEATAEAESLLDEATTEAKQRTATAEATVNRLSTLREEALSRLRKANEVLEHGEAALTPLEDEATELSNVTSEDPGEPENHEATQQKPLEPAGNRGA